MGVGDKERKGQDKYMLQQRMKNWGIGRNNELLVSIPPRYENVPRGNYRGKVVVMGRKTLESFPNGLPLKNRTNAVITGK